MSSWPTRISLPRLRKQCVGLPARPIGTAQALQREADASDIVELLHKLPGVRLRAISCKRYVNGLWNGKGEDGTIPDG